MPGSAGVRGGVLPVQGPETGTSQYLLQVIKFCFVFQTSVPSDYQFKYFSTEETLLDWIQTGPTTTLLDVPGPEVLQFYGQGTLLCLMTVLAYIAFT